MSVVTVMFGLFAVLSLADPFVPHILPMAEDRMRFIQCATVVRMIEREATSGKTPQEVSQNVLPHCDKLLEAHRAICQQLASTQIEKILGLVKEGKRVDFVCDILGYSHGFGTERMIPKDTCVKVIDALKEERPPQLLEDEPEKRSPELEPKDPGSLPFGLRPPINKLRTMPFLRRPVSSVCRKFETREERMACQIVSRLAMKETSEQISKGDSSEQICQTLQERKFIKLTEPTQETEAKSTEKPGASTN